MVPNRFNICSDSYPVYSCNIPHVNCLINVLYCNFVSITDNNNYRVPLLNGTKNVPFL